MKIEITQTEIDCICRHLAAFHRQHIESRRADFGEPCNDCPCALRDCPEFDWQSRIAPIADLSTVRIQLCYPSRPTWA